MLKMTQMHLLLPLCVLMNWRFSYRHLHPSSLRFSMQILRCCDLLCCLLLHCLGPVPVRQPRAESDQTYERGKAKDVNLRSTRDL